MALLEEWVAISLAIILLEKPTKDFSTALKAPFVTQAPINRKESNMKFLKEKQLNKKTIYKNNKNKICTVEFIIIAFVF